jgi:hypothetical protein
MTIERVRAIVREQTVDIEAVSVEAFAAATVRASVIGRDAAHHDEILPVWLIGESGGYKIVLRDDGSMFGLATMGFPTDAHPVLIGSYGDLNSTLQSM